MCSKTGYCFQGLTKYAHNESAMVNNHDRFMGKRHSLCVSTHLRRNCVSGTAAELPLLVSHGTYVALSLDLLD